MQHAYAALLDKQETGIITKVTTGHGLPVKSATIHAAVHTTRNIIATPYRYTNSPHYEPELLPTCLQLTRHNQTITRCSSAYCTRQCDKYQHNPTSVETDTKACLAVLISIMWPSQHDACICRVSATTLVSDNTLQAHTMPYRCPKTCKPLLQAAFFTTLRYNKTMTH